jgi:predicted Zn-dependent peptidase
MTRKESYIHERLDCGIELAALPMAGRQTTAFEIRVLAGMANEPDDKLGLARIVEETIDKGTARRSAQQLSDAFDTIGAQTGSAAGRETFVFRCSCLPEFSEQALLLHAEMLRTPAFPEEFCTVAVELAQQELTALEDEPDDLARKLISRHAYGPRLGRHALGTRETLGTITRSDIESYWRAQFGAARIQIAVGGDVNVDRFMGMVEREFAGFGEAATDGRQVFPVQFSPGMRHHDKQLEQEYILMCWPGVTATHDDYPVEDLMLTILGGGMSSRLFTEVREKQGLVYWVGSWSEHPRGTGMLFLGASTTPARCDLTHQTLLREVDRLEKDINQDELIRAKTGITARQQTHGDITRARVSELGGDLFQFGRPVPQAEKLAKIEAVTIPDICRYLSEHPRRELCTLTLGPRPLDGGAS